MTTTLERSLSRASSMSIPVSSPLLSVRREVTPPASSDPALWHIHDRINQLDSRLSELRSTVLTKDGYVDRRNHEDEYIRREFEAHRSIAGRIDVNVSLVRTDVDQLKLGIAQLKSNLGQLGTDAAFLRSDVDRLQKSVQQVHVDVESLQSEVCHCRVEISKLHTIVSQIRIDVLTLQHETSRQLSSVVNRFSVMEASLAQMKQIQFNSLAHTIHAPINPVPRIEEDGTLQYPDYFPTTVWRFWCLKKRSRSE
jgi:chromosome segregation ATPase